MTEKIYRGIVTFVHYEKHFATIEFKSGGKSKTVSCQYTKPEAVQRPHYFRVGDEVSFQLKLTDRGDKQTAYQVQFHFNPYLEKLVQKAGHENRFSGYLKKVDDQLFVKEQETYLFFPLRLSVWENAPGEQSFNAPVSFKLVNMEKQRGIAAELYFQVFKPEYRQALQLMEEKKPVSATISRISPYAAYLDLFDGKISAKINLPAEGLEAVKEGDVIDVLITYLSPEKIVVARA